MGKFSIVYVIGLSLIIVYSLWNLNATSTSAGDVYTMYYSRTMAHNIALAGANIGSQSILLDPTASTNLVDQAFGGGTFSMTITRLADSAYITSISTFQLPGTTVSDTVMAMFKFTPFSKYGWFTESETNGYAGSPYYNASDWKITGDSIFGYAHTNKHFNLAGTPYFNDKVTATNAPVLMKINGVENPIYKAGYEWGVTIDRPIANLTNLATIATSSSSLLNSGTDVSLIFYGDGTVNIRIPPDGTIRNDTLPLTTVAPNGVLGVAGGNMRITGVYKGQITLAALVDLNTGKGGNVYIDGNGIVASDDPSTDPASNDMMGIVAQNSAYITRDDTRTTSSVVNIQALVYCYNGELTAQDFWLIGKSGRVNLFGGVTQKTAGSLGVFNGGGLQNGMFYTIHHDARFLFTAPPSYPVSDKYELVSWWEN